MWRCFVDFLSSLKLTIICLSLMMVLVFVGTMAQVNYGIHEVQQRYFQSLFVWWPNGSAGLKIPIFPGGHLIGGVLLLNLIAAFVARFRYSWSTIGTLLTHGGLIVLLAGMLFTDLLSVESFMRLAPGETKNYSEDPRASELVLIDASDSNTDQVTTIPEGRLLRGGTIEHESLPFRINVLKFYRNSRLQMLDKAGPDAKPASTQGVGSRIAVSEVPMATAQNEQNSQSVVIELTPIAPAGQAAAPSLGTWLISDQLGAPQTVSYEGKTWQLLIRPARYYKPYSLTLQKFTHERYAGTQIAKNFASRATLVDPERHENRDVLIYMNNPLRYRGDTYFQSGFEQGDTATVLQVVYNPSSATPYIACIIVSAGLLFQFGYHFAGFLRRRKTALAQ